MTQDLEKSLTRELREVAAGVDVPAMPSLPTGEVHPTAGRLWMPILAAAAVVAILGVLALALGQQRGGAPQPAGPPTPVPSVGRTVEAPAPTAPTSTQPTGDSENPSAGEVPEIFTPEEALQSVLQAVGADDRSSLLDQGVAANGQWTQLVDYAAGQGGSTSPCRDNGGGTWDCEILLEADPTTVYYAILGPAENAYGWTITYVSVGGA